MDRLDREKFDAPYLVIGDSVLPSATAEQALSSRYFATFDLNQAVEMAGEYFMVRRYLLRNQSPKAVVYVGLNPFGKSLDRPWIETYVKRVFLRFSEILDLFLTKRDLRFSTQMMIYKLFPSFRFRDSVQSALGYRNPMESSAPVSAKGGGDHSILSQLKKLLARDPEPDLSKVYFERMLSYLENRGIDFYFLNAAESETNIARFRTTSGFHTNGTVFQSLEQLTAYFAELQKRFPRFHYDPEVMTYPDAYFSSHEDRSVHFNGTGAKFYRAAIGAQLKKDLGLSDDI